jgi:Holliday junction resolvase RusA-like endonuclease
MTIEFSVRGLPVAQGSARAFIAKGRAFVATEGNRTSSPLGAWRSSIASEARDAMGDRPAVAGPVSVSMTFSMPRPMAHFHTPLHGSGIRETAPSWHAKKPDIDKTVRAALDAISVVCIRDDAQVAALHVQKVYERPDQPVGVEISITELEP